MLPDHPCTSTGTYESCLICAYMRLKGLALEMSHAVVEIGDVVDEAWVKRETDSKRWMGPVSSQKYNNLDVPALLVEEIVRMLDAINFHTGDKMRPFPLWDRMVAAAVTEAPGYDKSPRP